MMYTNYAESKKRLDARFALDREPDSPEHLLEAAAQQLTRLLQRAADGTGIDGTDAGMVVQNIFEAAVVEAHNRLYPYIDHVAEVVNRLQS